MGGTSLARFIASLNGLDITFEGVLHRGESRGAIHATTAERRTDLLALEAHGRRGLLHAILASLADFAVRAIASMF